MKPLSPDQQVEFDNEKANKLFELECSPTWSSLSAQEKQSAISSADQLIEMDFINKYPELA